MAIARGKPHHSKLNISLGPSQPLGTYQTWNRSWLPCLPGHFPGTWHRHDLMCVKCWHLLSLEVVEELLNLLKHPQAASLSFYRCSSNFCWSWSGFPLLQLLLSLFCVPIHTNCLILFWIFIPFYMLLMGRPHGWLQGFLNNVNVSLSQRLLELSLLNTQCKKPSLQTLNLLLGQTAFKPNL